MAVQRRGKSGGEKGVWKIEEGSSAYHQLLDPPLFRSLENRAIDVVEAFIKNNCNAYAF